MTQIALFGTSADPPTAAHQKILNWLSHQFDWVAVWASDNPFKLHQTPLAHRAAMLQLLIDDIDPPRHNLQLQQQLSSPRAIITVEKAQHYWTDAQFTLVIGGDLVDQLPRWYRVEELLQQVKLLVVPRPGYPLVESELDRLRAMGAQVAIANLRGPKLSSTAYREQKDTHVLTPPIEEYIHRERLYECQDAAPKKLTLPSPSVH
jgi:nicotinate-nucleotide adenylyltransferase